MSRDGSITLPWADSDHTFRLGWGELMMLQEACDAGPFVILDRLSGRQCRLEDISHTMRLALIGGGKTPDEALKLVRSYVEMRPPAENLMFARGILATACYGPGDEKPGEAPGEDQATGKSSMTSPTENSASA
ncbi:MAG: gene transfer agent family protein [Devosia sp.]